MTAPGPAREPPPDDSTPGVLAAEDLESVLADAAVEAVQATGSYGGLVYLRAPDRRSLVLGMVSGVSPDLLSAWARIPVNGALPVSEAYRTGRVVHLAGERETMRRFPQFAVAMPYAFASASAPVRSRDGTQTFGVLTVLWAASVTDTLAATRLARLRGAAWRLGASLSALDEAGVAVERESSPSTARLPEASSAPVRVGLFDWNLETGICSADAEMCALFGIDPDSYDGRVESLAARVVAGGGWRFRRAVREAVETRRVAAWRLHVEMPDGRRRALELWGRVPEGHEGERLVGVALDPGTGAAAAEAVERLGEGVFSLDGDGRVTYANRALEDVLGVRLEDMLGTALWEVVDWLRDPSYEDRYRSAVLSQQPTAFLVRRTDGLWLAFALYPDAYGLTGRVVRSQEPERPQPPGPAGGARDGYQGAAAGPPRSPYPAPARLGAIYHVLHLASALTGAVTVRDVCQTVAERILPGFGGAELALYVVRDTSLELEWQSGYPKGFLDRVQDVPLGSRLPGAEALAGGMPLFFESREELAHAYPGIRMDDMGSWAFLPLIAADRPVGSCVIGFAKAQRFTNEDRSVLNALGGLVAQALERARLYDVEFTLARGLQHALLPHRLPGVQGLQVATRYLPATQGMEIGGDWYDVIETSHGVAVVIGDVEGHSVAAAAIMGQLRSAVRAFVTGGNPPGRVLAYTNKLLADLEPGLFASCCYLELDTATGHVEAARAGHPPPIVRHPDGRTHTVDIAGGVLLGVDATSEYPVTRLELVPGAVLALYTDGLVEFPGADIGDGIDELCFALAQAPEGEHLDETAERLLREARSARDRRDDIALLLARVTPGGVPRGRRPEARS